MFTPRTKFTLHSTLSTDNDYDHFVPGVTPLRFETLMPSRYPTRRAHLVGLLIMSVFPICVFLFGMAVVHEMIQLLDGQLQGFKSPALGGMYWKVHLP